MVAILSDVTKFECLGSVTEFDNTAQNETKLQRRLLQLFKSDDLPTTVYEVIRSTGSQRPKMQDFQKFTCGMYLASFSFDVWICPT